MAQQDDPVQSALHHVKDGTTFELPHKTTVEIPQPLQAIGIPLEISRLAVIEVGVALVLVAALVPIARRMGNGQAPKGKLLNFFESLIVFIRDQVARPSIGHHDADRFLPFILTTFFFVLFCNLAGMLPWLGSPTGSINVTAVLAGIVFLVSIVAGMKRYGVVKYWIGLVPHMDLAPALKIPLTGLIFILEVFGLLIRHAVLAVRLLANMFAGHLVLGVILAYIVVFRAVWIWYLVTPASVFGAAALSLLELLVAFLQAYIFAFLASLFIGMAVHQH